MARPLESRVAKLEQGKGPEGDTFYLSWVPEGEDFEAALADANTQKASLPRAEAICLKWTASGTPPLPRWTTMQAVSNQELEQLKSEVIRIYKDATKHTVPAASEPQSRTDVVAMTDRQLVGIALGIM